MNKYFENLVHLLFPDTCSGCGKVIFPSQVHLCLTCQLDLPLTQSHLQPILTLQHKFYGKLEVKEIYSFLKFSKKGMVQRILHQLKYKNKPELAFFIGKVYANSLISLQLNEKIHAIVAVPIHPKRLKIRGYNQAEKFAQGLSEGLAIPYYPDALRRDIDRISQTKTQSREKRYMNIKGVFSINDIKSLKDKTVALVDDVLTTGATLEQTGQLLLQGGCSGLYIITIASAYE